MACGANPPPEPPDSKAIPLRRLPAPPDCRGGGRRDRILGLAGPGGSAFEAHPGRFRAVRRILVTGSIAYDYIMVFPGKFRDHILPEKIHILSVSFLVDSLKRMKGGTGANIAYNLALLGERRGAALVSSGCYPRRAGAVARTGRWARRQS